MPSIYLDHNATTPVDSKVIDAMAPFFSEKFGNPSSLHQVGRTARVALDNARKSILKALNDPKGELIFTSGGTESDNLALLGAAHQRVSEGKHVVISTVEHQAVVQAAEKLEQSGWRVTRVGVDSTGRIDLDAMKQAIAPGTTLVSVMQANNEVGTIQPIAEVAQLAHAAGAWMHTDAVQAFGKIPVDVRELDVDLLSISAHKFYGPKGVGALYFRRGIQVVPQQVGGPHEQGLRAGTPAVAPVVGMQTAVEQVLGQADQLQAMAARRDRLVEGLKTKVDGLHLNGHPRERVPNTANVSFLGCEGEALIMALDLEGICVSTGAACSSGSTDPSHVLVAMGLSDEVIAGSVRFSLGFGTTDQEIDHCLEAIPQVVERIRKTKTAAS